MISYNPVPRPRSRPAVLEGTLPSLSSRDYSLFDVLVSLYDAEKNNRLISGSRFIGKEVASCETPAKWKYKQYSQSSLFELRGGCGKPFVAVTDAWASFLVMPSSTDGEPALYREVQRRLVQTGEWDRIIAVLVQKLNESGWMDEMRHNGKETARHLDPLKFGVLLEQLEPHAQAIAASIPLAIKQEVMDLLQQFLEKQFEA